MTEDERFAGVAGARPEIATFNLGTMSYEGYPPPARWPSTQHAWERRTLEASGDAVILNTLRMLRRLAGLCQELHVTPVFVPVVLFSPGISSQLSSCDPALRTARAGGSVATTGS